MQYLLLVIKIITAPVWVPFWLMKKIGRPLIIIFIGSLLAGCASTSSISEKSPCACDFESVNTGNFGRRSDA
jgi:hypothetical protein